VLGQTTEGLVRLICRNRAVKAVLLSDQQHRRLQRCLVHPTPEPRALATRLLLSLNNCLDTWQAMNVPPKSMNVPPMSALQLFVDSNPSLLMF
jgi:hypothetical protein